MRPIRTLAAAAILAAASSNAPADVSLTVYSNADPASFDPQQFIAQQRQGYNPMFAWQVPGFGVVRDVREVDFKKGANEISFTDVAAFIDPTTVSLVDLNAPDATVVHEQNFLFDLVSPQKLMEKYIDHEVTLLVNLGDGKTEKVTGTLLSAMGYQLVVKTKDGVRLINQGNAQVQLGEVPGGLITRPTLRWLIDSKRAGDRKVRTAYQTAGITWRSDYNLVLNDAETEADLGAWVTLMNLSGATYKDAQLKLIAGDVQRIQPPSPNVAYEMRARREMAADALGEAGFQEKSFYEYHLYTLPRKTTVADNSTQQIALFPTRSGVDVEKVLVYEGHPLSYGWATNSPLLQREFGNQSSKKVDAYIRFHNKEDNGLGLPLPKGKVRVYKKDDADGTLEFIGEDLIDHTSKNETVLVRTGQSFDVTGERTQTDFFVNANGHIIEETFKIEVSNAKDKAQKVIIQEHLYRWSNWEIIQKSDEYVKKDFRTIHFEVEVPAEGKKTVTYKVRYTW